jgi:hypothetical protein
MLNKTILSSPVTQTAAAVKQLITFQNHGQEPAEMPAFYRLSSDLVLVRNNKGDAYYVTTPKSCSCRQPPTTLAGHASTPGNTPSAFERLDFTLHQESIMFK